MPTMGEVEVGKKALAAAKALREAARGVPAASAGGASYSVALPEKGRKNNMVFLRSKEGAWAGGKPAGGLVEQRKSYQVTGKFISGEPADAYTVGGAALRLESGIIGELGLKRRFPRALFEALPGALFGIPDASPVLPLGGIPEGSFAFVQGEAGSGKTQAMVEKIAAIPLDKTILVTAHANKVVEDAIAKVAGHGRDTVKLELSDSLGDELNSCLDPKSRKVAFATSFTALMCWKRLEETPFDYILVDEGSQLAASDIIALSCLAKEGFLVFGDYAQLSPVRKGGAAPAFMARNIYQAAGMDSGDFHRCPWPVEVLKAQYRLPKRVALFARSLVGAPEDETENLAGERGLPGRFGEVFPGEMDCLDLSFYVAKQNQPVGNSHVNVFSALVSAALALRAESEGTEAMVICPYTDQAQVVSSFVDFLGKGDSLSKKVGVGTVHAFQGREADLVIFDITDSTGSGYPMFTKTGWGLGDADRLVYVALTRMRVKFVLVGDFSWALSDALAAGPLGKLAAECLSSCPDRRKRLRDALYYINGKYGTKTLDIGFPGCDDACSRRGEAKQYSCRGLVREFNSSLAEVDRLTFLFDRRQFKTNLAGTVFTPPVEKAFASRPEAARLFYPSPSGTRAKPMFTSAFRERKPWARFAQLAPGLLPPATFVVSEKGRKAACWFGLVREAKEADPTRTPYVARITWKGAASSSPLLPDGGARRIFTRSEDELDEEHVDDRSSQDRQQHLPFPEMDEDDGRD